MSMQNTVGGKILITSGTAGKIANECCCGGTVPSTCPNGDPEILVKIGNDGTTYSGTSPVNFCGESWTTAEINANGGDGTEKTICPNAGWTEGSIANPNQDWHADGATQSPDGGLLRLFRGTSYLWPTGTPNPRPANKVNISGGYFVPYPAVNAQDSVIDTNYVMPTYWAGVLFTPATFATSGNFPIRDDFFGSFTSSVAHLKYTWRRGNGW